MKKLMLLALLPLAVACNKSSNLKVAPVMKQTGTSTTFSSTQNFNGYTNNGKEIYTGSFNVTGLFNGAGTTNEIVNVTWPSSGSGTAISNATFTFAATQTFSFANGSITLQVNGTWWLTSQTSGAGSGSWNIISGTGNYSNISGSGTMTIDQILFNATGAYQVNDTYTGSLY
jgi:hypothetical protein